MRYDVELDAPEPIECPECGEGYWPEDGGCNCGFTPVGPEDVADDRNDRARERAVDWAS